MANRNFGGLGRRTTLNLEDLGEPQTPRPPRRQRNGLFWAGLSVLVVICLIVSAGGIYLFKDLRAEPTPTEQAGGSQQPTQPGLPGQPAVNTAVPGVPKEKLNVCIVNFGPYFPVLLIPNNNPVYELNVIPLNFYTDSFEDVVLKNPNYPFINPARESEQVSMLTDGRCDILLTTIDVQSKHPLMGQLIGIVGQSDGADRTAWWNVGVTLECLGKPINIFNDTLGCVFAVAEDSVGYFQALSFLKLANINPAIGQVRIDTYPSPELAVAACLNHKADVCSGWVPAIDGMDIEGQTTSLLSSDQLKTIYDGIFVSPNADANKSAAVLAFYEDWFQAVNMTRDNLPEAARIIAEWTYQGMPTNEYTFVWQGSEVDDLTYWFETYAQAGFSSQFTFVANRNLIYDIYKTGREVWEYSGLPLDGGFDPANMVDFSYFQALSGRTDLNSQNSFVNNSFSPFPEQLQPATTEELIKLPTLVEIVCPNVSFKPGKSTIPENTPEFAALLACGEQIKTLLNQSNVQILFISSAAWPDPVDYGSLYVHCGEKDEDDYCWKVALDRGSFVFSVFVDRLQIPPQRIAIDYQLGPKTGVGQGDLQDSRFVTIQVKIGGGLQ